MHYLDKEQQAEIESRIKVFEAVVWFPRLQAMVNASDCRGMIGECRGIKVMTWCCAGRCLIQLDRDDYHVTLITADDEKPWSREDCHLASHMGPMGLQRLEGEFWEALKLIRTATKHYDEITLIENAEVTWG